jgi:hypothetical protein
MQCYEARITAMEQAAMQLHLGGSYWSCHLAHGGNGKHRLLGILYRKGKAWS